MAKAIFRLFSDYVEFAFKSKFVFQVGVTPDENLPHEWFTRLGRLSQRGIVGRNRSPAQKGLAFAGHDFLESLLEFLALRRVGWKEDHAHAVVSEGGQRYAFLGTNFLQESVRSLQEYAGAVSGIGLCTASTPVGKISENG